MKQRVSAMQAQTASEQYTSGLYSVKTRGSWHFEDSAFKTEQVLRMLTRHPEIDIRSVCDIGCGSGGVIALLSKKVGQSVQLTGYEISPQAYDLASHFASQRCRFVLGEPSVDSNFFDLALILDVLEHVEDCFSFSRRCAVKARWKIYHIPLDTSVSRIMRGANCWDSVGHVHLFTVETAINTIEQCGQEVVDWFLTPVALARPHRKATRLTNLARTVLPERVAARLFGGYSLLALAR
jgi:SAM-dependent methyltransferase